MPRGRLVLLVLAFALVFAACSSTDSEVAQATPAPQSTTTTTPNPSPTPTSQPTATPTPQPTATTVPTATATPRPTPTPTPTFDVPSEPLFEISGQSPLSTEQINEMVLFVQAEAGRDFVYPPTIVLKAVETYIGDLLPTPEDLAAEVRETEQARLLARRLQALGQTTLSQSDLVMALSSSTAQLAGAYFDPEADEVVMPVGIYADDRFAAVLVHELVHALDWQYLDDWDTTDAADVAFQTGNYEQFSAFAFVIEGRARLLETTWRWPESWPQPKAPAGPDPLAEARQPDLIQIPDVLIEEFSARYAFGPSFIRLSGGLRETWDLLNEPPQSTEQVLVPSSVGQPIVSVEAPEADGPILETRIAGALDIGLILTGRGSLQSLAKGWAGGTSVMWGDDTETCIRYAVATDGEQDRDRLFGAFERWADQGGDRSTMLEGDLIIATSCGPYVP